MNAIRGLDVEGVKKLNGISPAEAVVLPTLHSSSLQEYSSFRFSATQKNLEGNVFRELGREAAFDQRNTTSAFPRTHQPQSQVNG